MRYPDQVERMAYLLAAVTVTMLASPIAAETRTAGQISQWAADYALRQLSCTTAPNPTPLLHFFIKGGYIRAKYDWIADSVSCWHMIKPFSIDTTPITAVCAFDENELIQVIYPNLYSR